MGSHQPFAKSSMKTFLKMSMLLLLSMVTIGTASEQQELWKLRGSVSQLIEQLVGDLAINSDYENATGSAEFELMEEKIRNEEEAQLIEDDEEAQLIDEEEAQLIDEEEEALLIDEEEEALLIEEEQFMEDAELTDEETLLEEATCYAERYPDLLQGFCENDFSLCHYERLRDHFKDFGKNQNLIWGCDDPAITGDTEDTLDEKLSEEAECYAERYPDLLQGYCEGDRSMCRHRALFEHYRDHGKGSHLIWGCYDRVTIPATTITDKISETRRRHLAVQEDPLELHILIFETDNDRISDMTLALQSNAAGIPTTVFGSNVEFKGFGSKWQAVIPLLEGMPPNTLVTIVDGRDTLLNVHKKDTAVGEQLGRRFIETFQALTIDKSGAVVMSAEGQCCVAALTYVKPGDYFDSETMRRAERACPSGTEGCLWAGDDLKLPWEDFQHTLGKQRTGLDIKDVYLNSGLVAGRPADLLQLLETANMHDYEDDQAVFTDLMYHNPDSIVLDYAQEVFGNARWTLGMEGGCPFRAATSDHATHLEHTETQSEPLFLHAPGKFFECLDFVANELDVQFSPGEKEQRDHRQLQNYGPVPSASPSEAPTPSTCIEVEIDFSVSADDIAITPGDYVDSEWQAFGLTLSASGGEGDTPRVFNSADPVDGDCGDSDLGAPNMQCPGGGFGEGKDGEPKGNGPNCSPLGNLLIVQEPGEVCPDDNVDGGTIEFEFEPMAEFVNSIGLLDIDYRSEVTITFMEEGGGLKSVTKGVPLLGDNSYQLFSLDFEEVTGPVKTISLDLRRSGGVSSISFCYPPVEAPTVAPGSPSESKGPSISPSESPSEAPRASPSESPTETFGTPSKAPSASPSEPPSESPSASPSGSETKPPGTCVEVDLDFSVSADDTAITPGDYVDTEWQAFGLTLSASGGKGDTPRVFDTANPVDGDCGDADLGAPNMRCSPSGPGVGEQGEPFANGPNCDPLGNALIIQDPRKECPDDHFRGGVMTFEFEPMAESVHAIGLLDIDKRVSISITFMEESGKLKTVKELVPKLGDNSYQLFSLDFDKVTGPVKTIELKMKRSGGVTSLAFCYPPAGPTDPPAPTAIASVAPSPSPSESEGVCEAVTVDFSVDSYGKAIEGGRYVQDEWLPLGMTLFAEGGVNKIPRIFDTANPGTAEAGDPDLGSPNKACGDGSGKGEGLGGVPGEPGENCIPLGNALIIQEPGTDVPDDNVDGGILTIDFPNEGGQYVKDISLLDVDYRATLVIVYETESGLDEYDITVPLLGDNSAQTIEIEQPNVKWIKVVLARSGAVTSISFCPS